MSDEAKITSENNSAIQDVINDRKKRFDYYSQAMDLREKLTSRLEEATLDYNRVLSKQLVAQTYQADVEMLRDNCRLLLDSLHEVNQILKDL
jgi:hypothetical protein